MKQRLKDPDLFPADCVLLHTLCGWLLALALTAAGTGLAILLGAAR